MARLNQQPANRIDSKSVGLLFGFPNQNDHPIRAKSQTKGGIFANGEPSSAESQSQRSARPKFGTINRSSAKKCPGAFSSTGTPRLKKNNAPLPGFD
jgi:hypothetical protein